MKWIAPNYYPYFSCIAGQCRHSCCIGWEIDIDTDTLEKYRHTKGEWGRRFVQNIGYTDETASFRLDAQERCPFLNREGLCDIILSFGEDALCQICTDHPRFYHFCSDRTEIGLGLCCEEAGRIILGQKRPFTLITLEDDGLAEREDEEEKLLLRWRNQLICDVQKRDVPLAQRVAHLVQMEPIVFSQWVSFLLELERMDNAWAERLKGLQEEETAKRCLSEWEVPFEQLLIYLLYRHLPPDIERTDMAVHLAFVVFSWGLIRHLFAASPLHTMEELIEIARLYSSEIEYSDINADAIIRRLRQLRLYTDF